MMSRPTTNQILDDCARELRDVVSPAVDDPAVKIHLQMMELLLRSCGARAAHEIAWMAEEAAAMEGFCELVTSGDPGAPEVGCLLEEARAHASASLTLEDQVANYDRIGRAFTAAVAHAVNGSDLAVARRAQELVLARCDHERALRPGFYFPGRT